MDSGERGMNPVVMTIINPWKKILAKPKIGPVSPSSQVLHTTD